MERLAFNMRYDYIFQHDYGPGYPAKEQPNQVQQGQLCMEIYLHIPTITSTNNLHYLTCSNYQLDPYPTSSDEKEVIQRSTSLKKRGKHQESKMRNLNHNSYPPIMIMKKTSCNTKICSPEQCCQKQKAMSSQ